MNNTGDDRMRVTHLHLLAHTQYDQHWPYRRIRHLCASAGRPLLGRMTPSGHRRRYAARWETSCITSPWRYRPYAV